MALLDQTLVVDVAVELSSAVEDGGGRSPYNPPSIVYDSPKRLLKIQYLDLGKKLEHLIYS